MSGLGLFESNPTAELGAEGGTLGTPSYLWTRAIQGPAGGRQWAEEAEESGRGPDWVLKTRERNESSRGSQPVAFRSSRRVSAFTSAIRGIQKSWGSRLLFRCLVAFWYRLSSSKVVLPRWESLPGEGVKGQAVSGPACAFPESREPNWVTPFAFSPSVPKCRSSGETCAPGVFAGLCM